ncbi:hypothetical protein ABW19_dt0209011 [Dactylella cylindrospora]|nr:hypothetical protein ABW19_dt0209011 [Dactylella cylindrospora]
MSAQHTSSTSSGPETPEIFIPLEILEMILLHLSRVDLVTSCRGVNKRWKNVIETSAAVQRHFTTAHRMIKQPCPCYHLHITPLALEVMSVFWHRITAGFFTPDIMNSITMEVPAVIKKEFLCFKEFCTNTKLNTFPEDVEILTHYPAPKAPDPTADPSAERYGQPFYTFFDDFYEECKQYPLLWILRSLCHTAYFEIFMSKHSTTRRIREKRVEEGRFYQWSIVSMKKKGWDEMKANSPKEGWIVDEKTGMETYDAEWYGRTHFFVSVVRESTYEVKPVKDEEGWCAAEDAKEEEGEGSVEEPKEEPPKEKKYKFRSKVMWKNGSEYGRVRFERYFHLRHRYCKK